MSCTRSACRITDRCGCGGTWKGTNIRALSAGKRCCTERSIQPIHDSRFRKQGRGADSGQVFGEKAGHSRERAPRENESLQAVPCRRSSGWGRQRKPCEMKKSVWCPSMPRTAASRAGAQDCEMRHTSTSCSSADPAKLARVAAPRLPVRASTGEKYSRLPRRWPVKPRTGTRRRATDRASRGQRTAGSGGQ